MSGPVVVAVGKNSHASLAYAASEAMRRGVPLHVVHAIPTDVDAAERDRLFEVGAYRLEVAAHRVSAWTFGRLHTTTRLVEGTPAEAMLTSSADASLVVVERPPVVTVEGGRSPSVKATLATRGTVPVVVVPSGWSSSTAEDPTEVRIGRDLAGSWLGSAEDVVAAATAPVRLMPDERATSSARPAVRHLSVVRSA